MTRATLLFSLLFLSVSAHARLTAICTAELYHEDIDHQESKQKEDEAKSEEDEEQDPVPEPQLSDWSEAPVDFTSVSESKYRAKVELKFSKIPDLTATLSLFETMGKNSLTWSSRLSAKGPLNSASATLGTSTVFVKAKEKDRRYRVDCDVYDRTESLAPQSITSQRERFRSAYLDGFGASKEYRGKKPSSEEGDDSQVYAQWTDAHDLYQFLLLGKSVPARFLKNMVDHVESLGLVYRPLVAEYYGIPGLQFRGSKAAKCNDAGRDFPCEIESLRLTVQFDRTHFANREDKIDGIFRIRVNLEVTRDSKSRAITGHHILSVDGFPYISEAGGGSSTSGGRINGGQ